MCGGGGGGVSLSNLREIQVKCCLFLFLWMMAVPLIPFGAYSPHQNCWKLFFFLINNEEDNKSEINTSFSHEGMAKVIVLYISITVILSMFINL